MKYNNKCVFFYTVGVEDDGGEQPEGHPAPADRGQDDPLP